ncbi:nuclear pore complex protein Nup160 homolog [Drosophila mojavensis]|uniref:nuclear pore complex protein Nup160 homolog n=1 Tax=Drosophila mojavensis TaxID=7230 RepID=UPI001CD163AB|nr:nuclear pore complex protein Nup160 homolog [Drosophila mojavensis]
MNTKSNMSYREVIPKNINPEEWVEVEINTGTQSTLQDIKTFGKSGSYCYNFSTNGQNRNRFIYWRTYQDIVELSEVSLDVSLLRNHLRLRFTDSAILNVSLAEQGDTVNLLAVTVSSIHRIVFPLHTDNTKLSSSISPESHRNSIFYDASAFLKDRSTFYVLDGTMAINVPHLAASDMLEDKEEAFFAVDYHSKLMLYIMNSRTGGTVSHEIKESHLMPRFLSNLKGALTGRGESLEGAVSMAFSRIEGEMFLLVLYRNNELRLWSVATLQSVASYACVDSQGAQGPQNSLLRKIDDHNFCVFLSHEKESEFICLSIVCNQANDANTKTVGLTLRHKVPAPEMDLADFDATRSHIWTLWSNAEGEFNVSAIFLEEDKSVKWVSAALEPPPDRYCLTIEQGVDPREAYCSYIFHPGRFDINVIAKALYMFMRANMQFDIKQITMGMLKEQVCQTVEDEIQNELKDFVVSDDEYLEIATRLWDRFYSCCEQYHVKFSEPTGLSVLGAMDAVCIIRRQSFALLRPCEMLEHLMLVGEHNSDVASYVAPYCRNDIVAAHGFIDLMVVINQLEKILSEDIKIEMEKKIYQRDDKVLSKLLIQITKSDEYNDNDDNDGIALPIGTVEKFKKKLISIPIVDAAINMLLDFLAIVDEDAYPDSAGGYSKSTRFLQSTGALFGSEYGISILAETVKQMAMIRFAVCRNLLILQYILYGSGSKSDYTITTNVNFLNSYYTLVWISETPISLNTPVNFEVSIQRLTRAQLFSGYTRPYSSRIYLNNQTTLLCLFLQSKGLFSALSMLLKDPNALVQQLSMRQILLQLVGCINQMLWPEAWNDVFPEWLFGTCHHIIIQDYERLLSGWCAEKTDSRRFMLAVSLLDCGEPHKAIKLFEQVQESVLKEPFLFQQVLKNTPLYSTLSNVLKRQKIVPTKDETKQALVHYYLKVIQLFEQHSGYDYIIQLAHVAMNRLTGDDPQLPMFQSIVFNNHLQLGHYEEAYHALVYNADTSRRKDCLRQLVIMLFQCKRFDLLMQLPYNSLQEEFENIVESRARSLSIDQNEVYNFLYAFHSNKGNMRKAATVMYEQAMRLHVDSDAPDALQKRCSSLLVCINSLYLVDSRYRWIAKPTIGDDKAAMEMSNNEDDLQDIERVHEVVVLELNDIRRELLHAEALKELAQHRKDVGAYEMADAEELSYLLATCGLYTAALKLARGHSFSVLPIFESLTAACVSISEDKTKDAWCWLQNNDLADLPHRSSAADMAWSLLQKLVVDNELNESTSIRKCVANRILNLNAFLPQWLYDSYKLANSREFLYLLVKHNRLLDAADLACEMIGAMLGAGSEYFDFQHSVNVTSPQLAFPINTIDLLLHGLHVNGSQHIEYEVAHAKLEEEVARYIETVKRTTDDKMKLAILTDRQNRQQRQIFG